jgi:hypothetical protein
MSMKNRVSFQETYRRNDNSAYGYDNVCVAHRLLNGGAITVLNRMTGCGWPDIETGYRSPCGQFWLASYNQDIREHLDEFNSEEDMADWVIKNANTCIGGHDQRCPAQSYRIFKASDVERGE